MRLGRSKSISDLSAVSVFSSVVWWAQGSLLRIPANRRGVGEPTDHARRSRGLPPAAFQSALGQPGIVVFDRFVPERVFEAPTVYVDPPPARSPLPVARVVQDARIIEWAADHPLGTSTLTGNTHAEAHHTLDFLCLDALHPTPETRDNFGPSMTSTMVPHAVQSCP